MTAIEDALAALLIERDAVTARLDAIASAIDALRPLTPAGASTSACSPLPAEPAGVGPSKVEKPTADFKSNGSKVENADEWGCDQCDYMGATQHALRIHITRAHRTPNDPAEVGQWSCEHCDMTFNRRSNRDRHRRTQHGDVRKPGAPKVTAPTAIPVGARPKPVTFDGPTVDGMDAGPMRTVAFDADAARARAAEAI